MAIPIGGLIRGASQGLSGYLRGRYAGQETAHARAKEEADRQRQALQDMLTQRITNARLEELQAIAQDRQRAQAQAEQQRQALAASAAQLRGQQGIDPRLAALPDPNLVAAQQTLATQAPRNIDRLSDEGIRREKELARYQAGLRTTGGTGGTGRGGVIGAESRAAAQLAVRAADEMAALYKADPTSPINPSLSAGIRGMGHAPLVGGLIQGFTEGQANRLLTPNQQRFRKATDRMLHNVSALLPKGGRSVQILNNLRGSFSLAAGETDPEVVARTVQAAQEVADTYRRALRGESIDLQSELENIVGGTGEPSNPQFQFSEENPFAY